MDGPKPDDMDLQEIIAHAQQDRARFEQSIGRFMHRDWNESTAQVADALAAPQPNGFVRGLLFVGPNGPWKDYLIRGLAQTLFDSEERIHEIDVSAYNDDRGGHRLVEGDRDCFSGHVYEAIGKLTRALYREPEAVFVFTHIDRTHHSVYDILCDLIDKRTLHTRDGGTLDFRQALLIFSIDCDLRTLAEDVRSLRMKDIWSFLRDGFNCPAYLLGRLALIT